MIRILQALWMGVGSKTMSQSLQGWGSRGPHKRWVPWGGSGGLGQGTGLGGPI